VPLLVDALPRLPPATRANVELELRERTLEIRSEAQRLGWPSWNLARERALEALRAGGY
jgi:hypothetical protein